MCKNKNTETSPTQTDPWTRLHQVFLAKIVLEVFGGGGAIWGFSEVVTFQNPDTLWFWRPCAATFGTIFFMRFLLQITDFINEHILLIRLEERRTFGRYLQIFSACLVLEVFGGGGAVWGFSEALTFRNSDNVEFWRFWSALAGALFFIRFILQTRDFIANAEEDRSKPWLRCIQIFSACMVLEVWGGAGAIWGFSEVLTLCNPDTLWFWRPMALSIGVIFFCRWILQVTDYVCNITGMDSTIKVAQKQMVRMYQIFTARMVLEFFGGAGAIWGFWEASALRNYNTVLFWRPAAMVFGFIFFIRWILQMFDYSLECKYNKSTYGLRSDQWLRLAQIFSARMVLEFFGGAGAIWGFSEALGLRNPDTVWFWCPCAILVGATFFARWFMQIFDVVIEMKEENKKLHNESSTLASKDDFSDEKTLLHPKANIISAGTLAREKIISDKTAKIK